MAIKDDFKILDDFLNNPGSRKSIQLPDGQTFTLEQARAERDRLSGLLETTKEEKSTKNEEIKNAEKIVKKRQATYDQQLRAFNKNNASAQEVSASYTQLQTAQEFLARLKGETVVVAPASAGKPATTTTPTTTPTTVTTPPTTTTSGTTVPSSVATTSVSKDKKKKKPAVVSWEETFKQKFPQYAYLLDETIFGADMGDVLRRAVTEKWYDSDQLETLMTQGVTGTNYYRNTTTAQQAFDKSTPANQQASVDKYLTVLKDKYGNLQFTDSQLAEIAKKSARDQKNDKALELFVYQQALSTVPGATGFVAATPASRALSSAEASRIRAIGRDYGVKLSDQEVQDVLTGRKSEEDLRQSYRMVARKLYKGAEEDIDAGLTIQQVFAPYRQYAAALLEKAPDQIDFIDANGVPTMYADALQGQDGPMSLGQWMTTLKTNPKYGYQYTNQANAEVSSMVSTLEKAFGLRI